MSDGLQLLPHARVPRGFVLVLPLRLLARVLRRRLLLCPGVPLRAQVGNLHPGGRHQRARPLCKYVQLCEATHCRRCWTRSPRHALASLDRRRWFVRVNCADRVPRRPLLSARFHLLPFLPCFEDERRTRLLLLPARRCPVLWRPRALLPERHPLPQITWRLPVPDCLRRRPAVTACFEEVRRLQRRELPVGSMPNVDDMQHGPVLPRPVRRVPLLAVRGRSLLCVGHSGLPCGHGVCKHVT